LHITNTRLVTKVRERKENEGKAPDLPHKHMTMNEVMKHCNTLRHTKTKKWQNVTIYGDKTDASPKALMKQKFFI